MLRFKVTGMTCNHCVQAVTGAVRGVAPEARIEADLATGEVGVAGNADPERVMAAIIEEGYEVERLAA